MILPFVILSGCSEPARIEISDAFYGQIMKLIEAGTKLSAVTSEGVNHTDFTSMLNNVRGSFELCSTMWPEDFEPESNVALKEAITVWNFVENLWSEKSVDPKAEPHSIHDLPSSIQQYPEFIKSLSWHPQLSGHSITGFAATLSTARQLPSIKGGKDFAELTTLLKHKFETNPTWVELASLIDQMEIATAPVTGKKPHPDVGKDPSGRIVSFVMGKSPVETGMTYASAKFKEARATLLNVLN